MTQKREMPLTKARSGREKKPAIDGDLDQEDCKQHGRVLHEVDQLWGPGDLPADALPGAADSPGQPATLS